MKYLVVAIVLFGFVSCQKDKKEYKEIQDANPTSLQNEIHEGKSTASKINNIPTKSIV